MRETYVRAIVNQQTQRRWMTAAQTSNKVQVVPTWGTLSPGQIDRLDGHRTATSE